MSTEEKIPKYAIEGYYEEIRNYNKPTELRNGEIIYLASSTRIHQKIIVQTSWHINSYIKANNGRCEVYAAPI